MLNILAFNFPSAKEGYVCLWPESYLMDFNEISRKCW